MDNYKLFGYLADHHTLNKTTNDWYLIECPFCAHRGKSRNMRVRFDYSYMSCFSVSCVWNLGGKIINFVSDMEGLPYDEAKLFIEDYEPGENINLRSVSLVSALANLGVDLDKTDRIKMPHSFKTILEGKKNTLGIRARKYLEGRGFDLKLLDSMGIGYCDETPPGGEFMDDFLGYIIIPFTVKGRLVYYIARDFLGTREKYRYKNLDVKKYGIGKETLLYNEDALDIHEDIFIVEGWADALTMGNAVALAGGLTLSPSQVYKIASSQCKRVIIALDDGFYKEGIIMANDLIEHKEVYVLRLEGGDPNELGLNEVVEIYEYATQISFSQIIKELQTM